MSLAIEKESMAGVNLTKGTSHAAMGYRSQSAIRKDPTDFLELPPFQRTERSV
jgi:hypothetical protein